MKGEVSRFSDRMCFTKDVEFASAFFCSLMNTIFRVQSEGWLPYNHLLFPNLGESLVSHSLYVLIGLIDHKRYVCNELNTEKNEISVKGTSIDNIFDPNFDSSFSTNRDSQRSIFSILLSQLYRKGDLDMILNGFIELMNNPLRAASTYLPGSMKKITYYEELLMLLWIVSTNNKVRKFLPFSRIKFVIL